MIAETGGQLPIAVVHERPARRRGPVGEQGDRLPCGGEGLDPDDRLGTDLQRLPAGGRDAQVRADRQQVPDQVAAVGRRMLARVEDA
ncbi:hypothetical protein AB0D38_45110 [Streptomyces sp. NPDC048279]|uniref:hypothetical protein n=1 Tax=Streptomyces sp. NPDC048279 TaxID=3154714 RepID=UPI0034236B09